MTEWVCEDCGHDDPSHLLKDVKTGKIQCYFCIMAEEDRKKNRAIEVLKAKTLGFIDRLFYRCFKKADRKTMEAYRFRLPLVGPMWSSVDRFMLRFLRSLWRSVFGSTLDVRREQHYDALTEKQRWSVMLI